MLSITINGTTIDRFLKNYDVKLTTVYDDTLNYTAMSGKKIANVLGVQRTLTLKFEPMSDTQIQSLFSTLSVESSNTITYKDPKLGQTTKSFICNDLPAASYFTSDDGILFWTIPDVTLVEDVAFSSAWGSG